MLSPGVRLGRYEVLSPLGAGGMGEVYRARDTELDRSVAVKVLPEDVASNPERLKRFEREARATAALSHPNVLTVFDVGNHDGRSYLVFELLEGTTLGARLTLGPLPIREGLSCATQIARGLAAAHARGIVHRDLKPDNLFLTRSGAIKILDFGLARIRLPAGRATTSELSDPGTLMGTVGYLSPEQTRGHPGDARSDIFALGTVLHEMLSGRHPFKRDSAAETLTAILRDEAPDLQAGANPIPKAVERLIRRCLEKRPEDRFQTANDLALALESQALAEGAEGPTAEEAAKAGERPYPGLSAYTEANAARFFGREAEVEALWEKLRRARLLAVIGPSGVGKTSFLRAGVIPNRPPGWAAVHATPGGSPALALARAIVPELVGDASGVNDLLQGVQDFAQGGGADLAVGAIRRWRARHTEALLVLDQLEELFTLNAPEVQASFVAFLARLLDEAQIHVLIASRDDFLFRCHAFPALDAVFQDLTPLGTPSAPALRRALVEPAARLGVRFEDEALAGEMVDSVASERGALPLLAFAVSRLWDERDRERSFLTRDAYARMGGVAGALAQHAESTLERIGSAREPLVREIFRNLTTAEGTRAALEREDLLSALPERAAAEEVLRQLVDARLLTSYGAAEDAVGSSPSRLERRERVQIVHESLLSQWPRLVRWRTQDEGSAQLRDQLRQAARSWDERGRPEGLLWTGASYLDYRAWRARYAGGLSTVAEAFAKAMTALAERRRRRRRVVVAAAFGALLAITGGLSHLWLQAARAREAAQAEARRAEAARLLALGQLQIDQYPTAAVAYALKSLEVSDSREGRLFALRALQRGPTAIVVPAPPEDPDGGLAPLHATFSPDGEWLAVGGLRKLQLFPRAGGPPRIIGDSPTVGFNAFNAFFGPNPNQMFASKPSGDLRLWSIPDGRELWHADVGPTWWVTPSGDGFFLHPAQDGPREIRYWKAGERESRLVGSFASGDFPPPSNERLAYGIGRRIYLRSLLHWNDPPRHVGTLPADLVHMSLTGNLIGVRDASGHISVWHTERQEPRPLRVIADPGFPGFDHRGRWLSTVGKENGHPTLRLWDLDAPAALEPLVLRRGGDSWTVNDLDFDPAGNWLAVAQANDFTLWHVGEGGPRVIAGQQDAVFSIAFAPDGRRLVSASADGTVRVWSLSPEGPSEGRRLLEKVASFPSLAIDPAGRMVAVSNVEAAGTVVVVPLDGGPARRLNGFSSKATLWHVAFSGDGRLVASGPFNSPPEEKVVRVWDLETGAVRVLGPVPGAGDGFQGGIWSTIFIDRERLLCGVYRKGFVLFDLRDGSSRFLPAPPEEGISAASHRGRFVLYSGHIPGSPVGGGPLVRLDLESGATSNLGTHGVIVDHVALDPTEQLVATASADGTVRVGPVTGEEPHVFFGHEGIVRSVVFSPDGRWLASSGQDKTIRFWRVPEAGKTPFHVLPRETLLARLRAFTNLRVVADPPGGYKLEAGPFPGWAKAPAWW